MSYILHYSTDVRRDYYQHRLRDNCSNSWHHYYLARLQGMATRRYHHVVKRADGTIAPNKSIFPLGLLANIDPLNLELARRVFWNNPRTETGPHSIAPSLKHNYTSDNPIPGGDLFPNCGPPSVAVPKPPCPAAQRPTLPQCLDNQ